MTAKDKGDTCNSIACCCALLKCQLLRTSTLFKTTQCLSMSPVHLHNPYLPLRIYSACCCRVSKVRPCG